MLMHTFIFVKTTKEKKKNKKGQDPVQTFLGVLKKKKSPTFISSKPHVLPCLATETKTYVIMRHYNVYVAL